MLILCYIKRMYEPLEVENVTENDKHAATTLWLFNHFNKQISLVISPLRNLISDWLISFRWQVAGENTIWPTCTKFLL